MFDYDPDRRSASADAVSVFLSHLRVKDGKVMGISPRGFVLCLSAWTHSAASVKPCKLSDILLMRDRKPSWFDPFFWAILSKQFDDSNTNVVPFAALKKWQQLPARHFVTWLDKLSKVNVRGLLKACQEQKPFSLAGACQHINPFVLCLAGQTLTPTTFKSHVTSPMSRMMQGNPAGFRYWGPRLEEIATYMKATTQRKFWIQCYGTVATWGRACVSLRGRSRPKSMYTVNALKRSQVDPKAVALHFTDDTKLNVYDLAAVRLMRAVLSGEKHLVLVGCLVEDPALPALQDVLVGVNPTQVYLPPLANPCGVYRAGPEVSWDVLACAVLRQTQSHVIVYVDVFKALALAGPIADLVEYPNFFDLNFKGMLQTAQEQFPLVWAADLRRQFKLIAISTAAQRADHRGKLEALQSLTTPKIKLKPTCCSFETLVNFATMSHAPEAKRQRIAPL
ncbi:MAG: hypothetical protein ACPGR8_01155 [Limisphaerales bacterium]